MLPNHNIHKPNLPQDTLNTPRLLPRIRLQQARRLEIRKRRHNPGQPARPHPAGKPRNTTSPQDSICLLQRPHCIAHQLRPEIHQHVAERPIWVPCAVGIDPADADVSLVPPFLRDQVGGQLLHRAVYVAADELEIEIRIFVVTIWRRAKVLEELLRDHAGAAGVVEDFGVWWGDGQELGLVQHC